MIVLSCDIETTPINFKESPRFLFGGIFDGQQYYYYDNLSALAKHLFNSNYNDDIVLLFHNIAFEGYLLLEKSINDEYSLNFSNMYGNFPRFAIFSRKLQILTNKQTKHRSSHKQYLYLIDTMNYHRFGLKKLMPIFYQGGEEAKNTGEFDRARNEADCICTYRLFDELPQQYYFSRKRLKPFVSASQLAFNELKKMSNYKWQDQTVIYNKKGKAVTTRPVREAWLLAIEKSSYHGGIVWLNPLYKGVKTFVKAYDVNSEYPFVMRDLKVPVGLMIHKNCELNDKEARELIISNSQHNNFVTLYKITCTVNDYCLPIIKEVFDGLTGKSVGERLIVDKGTVNGWYWETELLPALAKLTNITITELVAYNAVKGLFNAFVDKYYDIKSTSTNEVDRYFAKLILNSAYGRFGMKKRYTHLLTPEETFFIRTGKATDINAQALHEEFGKLIKSTISNSEEAFNSVTAVASLITATARGYIMNQPVDYSQVVYIDTDSLYFMDEFPTHLLDKKRLGAFKLEKRAGAEDGCFITTYAKKYYQIEDSLGVYLKAKGLPKSAILIGNHLFLYKKVLQVREASKLKNASPFTFKLIRKNLLASTYQRW